MAHWIDFSVPDWGLYNWFTTQGKWVNINIISCILIWRFYNNRSSQRVVHIISPVRHAYAAPSIFYGRCICSAQQNFIKTLILFFKIEILELKFRKNTVFFVIKKYKFWLSYFFSKMKLKKNRVFFQLHLRKKVA